MGLGICVCFTKGMYPLQYLVPSFHGTLPTTNSRHPRPEESKYFREGVKMRTSNEFTILMFSQLSRTFFCENGRNLMHSTKMQSVTTSSNVVSWETAFRLDVISYALVSSNNIHRDSLANPQIGIAINDHRKIAWRWTTPNRMQAILNVCNTVHGNDGSKVRSRATIQADVAGNMVHTLKERNTFCFNGQKV